MGPRESAADDDTFQIAWRPPRGGVSFAYDLRASGQIIGTGTTLAAHVECLTDAERSSERRQLADDGPSPDRGSEGSDSATQTSPEACQ